jgi:NHS family xanthosine MFS transporter
MMFYMPTISLSNSVAYNIQNNNFDVVKVFHLLGLGTIGIAAMWMTNLSGTRRLLICFIFPVCVFLGIYSFTLPECPAQKRLLKCELDGKIGIGCF